MAVVCLLGTGTASAAWLASSNGFVYSEADTAPAGNVPTASASGQNVTVTWSASAFPAGGAISEYVVRRYNYNDQEQTMLSNCSGTVSGLSCTENSVPAGTWRYTVTPKHSNWLGTESAKSTAVTVVPVCSSPGTQTITADADSYVREDGATTNFGADAAANVKSDLDKRRRMVIHFPLPSVPTGCRVTGATLRLNASASTAGRTIYAYRAASSWGETTTTWNNGPAPADSPASSVSAVGWIEWSVASHVRALYDGTNTGFVMLDANESISNSQQTYSTREGANPPQLVLTFGASTAATVTSTGIMKSSGGTPGYIKPGGTYRVYANITGSPLNATADVSAITTGSTAASLSDGSYSAGGVSYNYRSGLLTADASLSAGPKAYTIATAYSSLDGSVQVLADSTPPTAANVDTTNKAGGIAGRPEIGDTVYYEFSEGIDPQTVLDGWTGSSTNVVVELFNNGANDDTIFIRNAGDTAQLPFGSVDTNGDSVSATTKFGVTGTPSTMVQSGTRITITLGTASGTSVKTDTKTVPMVWSPTNLISDLVGNPMSTATATETGAVDVIF